MPDGQTPKIDNTAHEDEVKAAILDGRFIERKKDSPVFVGAAPTAADFDALLARFIAYEKAHLEELE